ncbi:hypothetical protein MHU86_16095 [Fragilaria crotonensis]|nr:hypothetical protein MHU86_16095 [Fragilaria crotonensis]
MHNCTAPSTSIGHRLRPGIRVLVHVKPAERTTWSPHGADGWYTGPALESYRCYTVWLWDTRATRVCDTLSWFPTKVTMPLASSNDLILAGIHDILHALHHPSPASPLAPLTDSHHRALIELTSILTSLASPQTNPIGHATVAPLRVASRQPLVLFSAAIGKCGPTSEGGCTQFHHVSPSAPLSSSLRDVSSSHRSHPTRLSTPSELAPGSSVSDAVGLCGITPLPLDLRPRPSTPQAHQEKAHDTSDSNSRSSTRRPVHHQHGTRANKQRPLHHIAAAARALCLTLPNQPRRRRRPLCFPRKRVQSRHGPTCRIPELSHCSEDRSGNSPTPKK